MTIIKPNSIAGITSITAQEDVINFYSSDGTAAGLQLNGVNFNTTSGVSTFNNLTVGAALSLTDNVKAQFGTGGDLQIYSDGTNGIIKDTNTGGGDLRLLSDVVKLMNSDGTKVSFKGIEDGAAELYHDNSKKFETTSTGIDVTGTVGGDQLNITGVSTFQSDVNFAGATGVTSAFFDSSDNSLKFNDGVRAKFGNSQDLQIHHDGANSYISDQGTGQLQLTSSGTGVEIKKNTGEAMGLFKIDDSVELYYDNSKKFETTGQGAIVTGILTATQFSGGGIGVGIQSAGNLIGYGITTLNFVGAGNTFAINGTTVDVSIAGGGGGGGSSDGSDFNTGITSSITALPVGVGTTVLTLPSTAGKQYLVSSILASNVATGNTEVNIIGAFDFTSGYGGGERSYFAYNIPIPTGTALELLEESQILNPNDRITVRSTDVNRNGVDNAVELFITYEEKTSSDYFGIGISTVGLAVTSAIGIFTSTTYPSIVQSIRVVNRTDDGDYPISVDVTSGVTTIRIVDNLIVPKYGSVELLSKEKRLYIGDEIKVQVDQISTIDVQVSGKKITS